jgi:hypothetical protein
MLCGGGKATLGKVARCTIGKTVSKASRRAEVRKAREWHLSGQMQPALNSDDEGLELGGGAPQNTLMATVAQPPHLLPPVLQVGPGVASKAVVFRAVYMRLRRCAS